MNVAAIASEAYEIYCAAAWDCSQSADNTPVDHERAIEIAAPDLSDAEYAAVLTELERLDG